MNRVSRAVLYVVVGVLVVIVMIASVSVNGP
jgi:hypothetical protein